MSTSDSESRPRGEPLTLKPTTLPHPIHGLEGLQAAGAGGEWIGMSNNDKSTNTPSPSTIDLVRTVSQTSQLTDYIGYQSVPRFTFPANFQIFLRLPFYILVLAITIGLTLAACKFTNIWDPCEHLYINTTECKVTSYMKGMVYYTECTEEHSCILPGFESNIRRQGWTLHKPNDTGISPIDSSESPTVNI